MKCELCNNDHDGSYGSGRFCSYVCARKFSSTKHKRRTKIVKCISCGKQLEVDDRASDKMCKCDDCRIGQKRSMSKPKKTKKIKYCLWCGEKVKNKFCNNVCKHDYYWDIKKKEIAECNGVGPFSISTLKHYVLELHGHICCICGGTEWMGHPIPLVLDHINGRASDNRLENFRLVCGNCDMQLPTYKSKNKNSDRKRLGNYL